MYFEPFKHMTTLNAAAVVVVLTLARDLTPGRVAAFSIVLFLISLISSLHGMWEIAAKELEGSPHACFFRCPWFLASSR